MSRSILSLPFLDPGKLNAVGEPLVCTRGIRPGEPGRIYELPLCPETSETSGTQRAEGEGKGIRGRGQICPRPVAGTQRAEGGKKRIPRAEAEIRVRDWLMQHAKANPARITRDRVAAGTGVSAGAVSKTAAWKAFRDRRDAEAKRTAREVPLTDAMRAVIPADCETPAELAALIEEQQADDAIDAEHARRHKRRRKRCHGSS